MTYIEHPFANFELHVVELSITCAELHATSEPLITYTKQPTTITEPPVPLTELPITFTDISPSIVELVMAPIKLSAVIVQESDIVSKAASQDIEPLDDVILLDICMAREKMNFVRTYFILNKKCPTGYMRLNMLEQAIISMYLNCMIDK